MTSRSRLPLHIDTRSNLPIFAQLEQQITWLIASGSLKSGDLLPSIRALGGQLGIHWHTVRQAYLALEAAGLVETRRRTGTRILPFDPGSLSHRPAEPPSHTIGVLLPSMDPFYDPFLEGLEERARQTANMPIVCFTRDDEELARQLAHQLLARGVDGLILVSPTAGVFQTDPSRAGPPLVYVDAPHIPENSILLDLEGSAFQATSHLIGHGHSRIGLITAPRSWPNFEECCRGYARALACAGLELDRTVVIESPAFRMEGGYQAMVRLLEAGEPPSAIFAAGDLLAAGAMHALRDRGLAIPRDVAIASKDNLELAAMLEPPLTSVSSPTYQMGVDALNMLSGLMAGKRPKKKKIVLPTDLVIRKSCGCEG